MRGGPGRARAAARDYLGLVAKSFQRLRLNPEPPGFLPAAWVPADGVRIVWFMQTYKDLVRLRATLARLRSTYAEARVLVVSDGDPDPELARACEQHAAVFTLGSRLFAVEHGGEPVQRMLDLFLQTDGEILIKIDPDTHVRRRFQMMPPATASALYGTVQTAGAGPTRLTSIQGGCIIVPRRAAELLDGSGLMKSGRLKPPRLEWSVGAVSAARAGRGLTSYDWTLGWACRELGLACEPHPEVFSRYRPSLIDALTERRVAVSHPRFEIAHVAQADFYFSGLRAAVRAVLRGAEPDDR
jgi:hypothetical protein